MVLGGITIHTYENNEANASLMFYVPLRPFCSGGTSSGAASPAGAGGDGGPSDRYIHEWGGLIVVFYSAVSGGSNCPKRCHRVPNNFCWRRDVVTPEWCFVTARDTWVD